MGIEIFKKHLREKRAIKIATGMNNYNPEQVAKICRAAQNAKASAVEIASRKELYNIARKNTKLPVFISSIHPFEILQAVQWGVDGVQIGNYSELYKKSKKFSATEIYDVVLETMGLINKYNVFISVTIPASIDNQEQIDLVRKLEYLGISAIQAEGYRKSTIKPNHIIESANVSIHNMTELSQITTMPVIVSCAMNTTGLKVAFDNGANGVTVDYAVNKLDSEAAMQSIIMEMVSSMSHRNSLNKELVKNSRELVSYYL